MSEIVKCLDLSHWQGFPDFNKVKAAGVLAVIHKATEGASYVDPNRAKNCADAIRAGLAIATYHWLKPGGTAKAQIAHYLKTIDPVPGERVVIDYEERGCTLSDLKEAVRELLADPRGLKVTVYSGHLLKEQLDDTHDAFLADNTDLWLAQYTDGTPTWSQNTYPRWTLWQYSDKGTVSGVTGSKVDLNRFNGTDEDLLAWIDPEVAAAFAVVEATPKPEAAVAVPVALALNVPEHVALSLTVNGKVIYGEGVS